MGPAPSESVGARAYDRTLWLSAAALVATLLTAADAYLLQRRWSFLTGGFLAYDYAATWLVRLTFLAVSWVSDLAVSGVVAATGAWLGHRLRLSRAAVWTVALLSGLFPLAVVDAIRYELLRHMGDTFDLPLMFDLVGRRPAEILAQGGRHLAGPALAVLATGVALASVVWAVHRRWPARAADARPRWRLLLAVCATAFVFGTAVRAANPIVDSGMRRKPSGQVVGVVVSVLSDVDRDGFGLLDRPRDPAPWNAAIWPFAVDRPGNGVDENGIAGDLPAPSALPEPLPAETRWRSRPDVVMVFLETVRADAVGARLDGRRVTPVMDALADRGRREPAVFSHNGFTVQSRWHLFSGALGPEAGETTLVDDFHQNGYEVAYFSGQDESFGVADGAVGFERADVFYDARQDRDRRFSSFGTPGSLAVPAPVLLERIQQFLDRRQSARSLFLYVNFADTHFPYNHAGTSRRVSPIVVPRAAIGPGCAADLRAMYLNAVGYVDDAIGDLLARVREHSGREPAVIILSDHGESLYDDGALGHGFALNDVQTRVPFVVSGLPLRLPQPAGQTDVRRALRCALEALPEPCPYTAFTRETGRVFQYLGRLPRPRQIGFVSGDGRTRLSFDMRRRLVQVREGTAWQRPSALGPGEHREWLQLVRLWETLRWRAPAEPGHGPHNAEPDPQ